eukprot:TRINITY_DN17368_c0_g1_i2.p1 TRINITY_DN17368_c0_g1~~TRINITY_DN17368_c0_g1_i2.p1  ORF type:complete len:433 (-),score=90.58 TRINITY_DN17368_c0_g1_i2:42-1340(-)
MENSTDELPARTSKRATIETLTRNIQELYETIQIEREQHKVDTQALQEELLRARAHADEGSHQSSVTGTSCAGEAKVTRDEELEELRRQVRSLQEQIRLDQQQVHESVSNSKQAKALDTELAELKSQLAISRQNESEASNACVWLQTQVDKALAKVSSLQKEMEELRNSAQHGELDALERERETSQELAERSLVKQKIEKLKEQFCQTEQLLKRDCAELRDQLAASSRNYRTLSKKQLAEIDALKKECERLRQESPKLQREYDEYSERSEQERSYLKMQLEASSKGHADKVMELERDCQQLREELRLSRLAVGMETSKSEKIREEMAAEVQAYTEQIAGLEEQNQALQDLYQASSTERAQLKKLLGGASRSVSDSILLKRCEDLQAKLNGTVKELELMKLRYKQDTAFFRFRCWCVDPAMRNFPKTWDCARI